MTTDPYSEVRDLLNKAFQRYNQISCPCAFPRFRQYVSIDCANQGRAYSCYETEILIHLAEAHYQIEKDAAHPDAPFSKWHCPKCQSQFQYSWMDFSISVSRQTLKPIDITIPDIGRPAALPIPLYLGLTGHAFPGKDDIKRSTLEELEAYLMERD